MAMQENFGAFFSTAEFADTATLDGVACTGIFDNGYDEAGVGQSGMSSGQPIFTVPSSVVPASPVGKVLVISTGLGLGTYHIVESRPDGTGLTLLMLERG